MPQRARSPSISPDNRLIEVKSTNALSAYHLSLRTVRDNAWQHAAVVMRGMGKNCRRAYRIIIIISRHGGHFSRLFARGSGIKISARAY